MKKKIIYITIILILGFTFYTKIYIPKNTFETTNATVGNMSVKVNGVGNVGAKDIYKIGSIYGGKVTALSINEGDFIKKGTIIAQIDSVDLKDKISEQKANIKKLQNEIKSLKLEEKSAKTTYNYQEQIFDKNKNLFKKRAISELDFNKYKTNKKVAKLQVKSISSKIDALYSQISQIQANTNGLNQRLSRYTIISPVDGYVTQKHISNFAIINPNQTLIDIVNPTDVWVETNIDTRISGDVKIGNSATITLRSSNIKYDGKVTNIKPINNSVTNEREVDISFDNLPIPFYLEEQAIIQINIKVLRDITKIPAKVVTLNNEKNGIWLVKNGRVSFKPLKILAYDDKSVATKDITTKENIVIPNPKNKALKNGMKIYEK